MQAAAPTLDVVPAAHATQEVLSDAAYLPAVHDVQLAEPAYEYWPLGQPLHTLVAAYLPPAHFVQPPAPALDTVPPGQELHVLLPDEDAYLPAVQAQHFDVLQEDVPALHAEQLVAPVPEAIFPLPHAVQDPPPLEPWYLPEGQAVHDVAPPVEYLPAVHELHDPPVPALPAGQAAHPVVEEAY